MEPSLITAQYCQKFGQPDRVYRINIKILELMSFCDFPVRDGAFCDPGSPEMPFQPTSKKEVKNGKQQSIRVRAKIECNNG